MNEIEKAIAAKLLQQILEALPIGQHQMEEIEKYSQFCKAVETRKHIEIMRPGGIGAALATAS